MTRSRRPPTRQSLLQAQRTLARVERGAELLRRKREALVTELVRLARPAVEAQARIGARAAQAHALLAEALAAEGEGGVRAAGWPSRVLALELRPSIVWGLPASEFGPAPAVRRTLGARGQAPGARGAAVVEAATAYEDLVALLLESAPRDMLLRRLAAALSRTARQVNTLERRLGPELREETAHLRRTLEEREREEHGRLGRAARPDQSHT